MMDLDEDDGESYRGQQPTTVEERLWYASSQRDSISRCQTSYHGWYCTLRPGHPGQHVAGFSKIACGARWWGPEAGFSGLDCGPDEGA